MNGTPFKYFDYFQESEHDVFAGREDEIQEVLTGVTRGRSYVLYGGTGVGKTSLLRAGVIPRWRQRGFHPLWVRVLESPVAELCAALASELQCPELARDMDPRVLVERSAHEPLIIVLDQFEEFFIRFKERPQEREAFITFLGRIYQESAANVRLVFGLRESYYAQLEDLRTALPDLTGNGLRLLPLTAYGTRQAIVRPLLHVGAHYDEVFVNSLVDQLAAWQFEPFVLQIACAELYRDAAERRGLPVQLTREDLERMGNVEGILHGYSRQMTSGLAAERLFLVRLVLDGLITPEHTRRTARVEDLLAGPARARREEIQEVLQHLTERRLLRRVERPDGPWFELQHERLVGIIEQWLDDDPQFIRFRMTRHLITTLSQDTQWWAEPHWLLTKEQLEEQVDPWKEWLRLDGKATEFVLRSSIHARSRTVPYWASRYEELGAGTTAQLLLKLLEHPDPGVRLGAAVSCSRVEDGSGGLAPRCLRLALEAPDAELRRAAGGAFARLARPEELSALRGVLAQADRRTRALEVMADLREAGHPLQGFPGLERARAELLVRRRRVERNRRLIQRRSLIGAFTGAQFSLVWSVTIGLGLLYVLFLSSFPQHVTLRWPRQFLSDGLGVVLLFVPFLFMPLGMLLGWRVARRTGLLIALHGHEHWGYPTFRSGTLILSSMLLSCIGMVFIVGMTAPMQEVMHRVGLMQPWLLMIPVILATSVLAWLLTWMLVALGSRCIPVKARIPIIYVWAFLGSASFPLAIEMLLARSALWPGTWSPDLSAVLASIAAVTCVISSFQSFVIICALAIARKRLGGAWLPPRRAAVLLSRATLVLGAIVVVGIGRLFWGSDTLPFQTALPLGQELVLDGELWKVRDADYATILGPGGESFALSVHEGGDVRTRLLLDGVEVTGESLLVSSQQRVLAAVTARPSREEAGETPQRLPSRLHYSYQLDREPIQREVPARVSRRHWSLVSLQLRRLPGSPGEEGSWQARLEGTLPPDWKKDGSVVHVHPVLINLPVVEKGACLGIFGTSDRMPGFQDALVLRNREDSGTVPAPNSEAVFFLESFRVQPEPGGHWSLQMTVSPSRDVEPRRCMPAQGLRSILESGRNASEDSHSPPWLLVAVKLG